jgi:hypothetical protein
MSGASALLANLNLSRNSISSHKSAPSQAVLEPFPSNPPQFAPLQAVPQPITSQPPQPAPLQAVPQPVTSQPPPQPTFSQAVPQPFTSQPLPQPAPSQPVPQPIPSQPLSQPIPPQPMSAANTVFDVSDRESKLALPFKPPPFSLPNPETKLLSSASTASAASSTAIHRDAFGHEMLPQSVLEHEVYLQLRMQQVFNDFLIEFITSVFLDDCFSICYYQSSVAFYRRSVR